MRWRVLPWSALLLWMLAVNASEETCSSRVLNESSRHKIAEKSRASLDMFECPARPMSIWHVFVDVHLDINLTDTKIYQLYQGPNCSVVEHEFATENRMFGLLKSVSLWRSMQLDPFVKTIVGIDTTEAYSIGLIVNPISAWRLVAFAGAILLYIFAPYLVRNAIVFYAGGCTTGALLSALLLVFLIYRVAPKKTIGVPILIGGWSVAAWMAVHAWHNFSSLIFQYQKFVAAYFVTAVVISFAYCYKQGPPTDVRSLDVATWFFQLMACFLIYFSSQVPYVSYVTILLLVSSSLLLSDVSRRLFDRIAAVWDYFFPKPRRLLTQDEYEKEGNEYTRQQLASLRSYCRSPDANQWRITSRLHTPTRLARFVEGDDDHVNVEEERDYMDYMMGTDDRFVEADEMDDSGEDSEMERERVEAERWEREERERRRRARRSMPAVAAVQHHSRRSSGIAERSPYSAAPTSHTAHSRTVPRSATDRAGGRPSHHSSSSASAASSGSSVSSSASRTAATARSIASLLPSSATPTTGVSTARSPNSRSPTKKTIGIVRPPARNLARPRPRPPSIDRDYYSSDEDASK